MDSKVASALETIARSARRPARPQRAILLVLWTSAPCVERASVNRPAIISPSTTFEIREMGQSRRAHVELQSLMRNSYAVFCLNNKTYTNNPDSHTCSDYND